MKKYITKTLIVFKLSFLSSLFIGCAKENKPISETKKRTAILDAISIEYSTPTQERLSNEKIEQLKEKLSSVLTYQLQEINTKEATLFDTSIKSCDIEGEKEVINQGEIIYHAQEIIFRSCQEEEVLQNGTITLTYNQADEDGRFPKSLTLDAQKNYSFNEIELHQGSHIVLNNITYTPQAEVQGFDLKVSGEIRINQEYYELQNFIQRVRS